LQNGQKVFCSIISNIGAFDFFIVLLFEKSVPLGMAEMNLFKCSKAIEKLILEKIDLVLLFFF